MAKLTEKQWAEIQKRLLGGETSFAISKDYPVSRQAIDKKLGCATKSIKAVANQIVDVQKNLKKLPEVAQVAACNLADDLMAISMHLGSGAKYGSMTFHRLAGIANQHAQKLDDADPDPDTMMKIAQLTEIGNKSAMPALNMLAANKDRIGQGPEEKPKTLSEFYGSNS